MLHANITALCFVEQELLPIKVLHCRNGNFLPFCLLWPWPWPDNLHIRTWPIFHGDILHVRIWTSYVKAFKSYCLTDRYTDRTKIIYHTVLRVVNNNLHHKSYDCYVLVKWVRQRMVMIEFGHFIVSMVRTATDLKFACSTTSFKNYCTKVFLL